jgi:hypothetical protein
MIRSRSTLLLSFSLVFAGGLLVGALGHRYYAIRTVQAQIAPAPPNPDQWRKHYMEEMNSRLSLSPDQTKILESILDETRARYRVMRERFRPEMDAIRQEQIDKVNAVLSPAQRIEYEKLRKEREDKRKAAGDRPPPPAS